MLGLSATAGKSAGYLHSMIADGTGRCVKNPATPLLQGRLPINTAVLPACVEGAVSPNPCVAAAVSHTTAVSTFDTDCNVASTAVVSSNVPAVRFKNPGMVLNFVNPTYKGDAVCSGDAAGSPLLGGKNVPAVFTGMAFTFRQSGGYAPLRIGSNSVVLPVRVVRGPQQSIWIVDEGDYLTENAGVPSTRGKVFRVESTALSIINVMQ